MALTFSIGWVVTAVKPRDKQISAEDRKAEEYAVYSALINEFCANNDRIVLIQARTSSCYLYDGKTDESEFIRDNLPSAVSRDTLDDYKAVDRQIEVLTDNFVLTTGICFSAKRSENNGSRAWKGFGAFMRNTQGQRVSLCSRG